MVWIITDQLLVLLERINWILLLISILVAVVVPSLHILYALIVMDKCDLKSCLVEAEMFLTGV